MDSEHMSEYTPYYTEVAETAKVKGVTVSVISLVGEDCSLETLGVVAEGTGGEVERVDPRNIASNFQSILTKPVFATGCMATILLHRGLMFRNEVDDEYEVDRNYLVKDLGNITADSECTFSYGFRPKSQIDVSDLTEVPFQVQLVFSRLNGMKCVRIATASIQVTEDRALAERQASLRVIGTHAAQKAAKFAREGDFERAQMEARAAKRFIERNFTEKAEEVHAWSSNVEVMDAQLREERKKEKEEGARDKNMRKKALKSNDSTSLAIAKSKNVTSEKLFL